LTMAEKLTTIAENEQRVYDAGMQAEYDRFWDVYQSNYRQNYMYAFAGRGWKDSIYQPTGTLVVTQNAQYMYAYSSITDTKVTIDASSSSLMNFHNVFANAAEMKVIRLLKVSPITPLNSAFNGCTALESITIKGTIGKAANFKWCPLTKESILNVVSVLSNTTSGLTVTFNTSAVNTAFETVDGAADGSQSAEWKALVDRKPNWTFALAE